jgi:arsenate reductase (glutaredoxin)
MHYDKNDLILLYNNDNEKDRKTLAYAHTITRQINKQEVNSVRVSDTLFGLMLDQLAMDAKSIVNKADPFYQQNIKGHDLSAEDWHAVIRKRPSLLRAPMAMYRGKTVLCNTPTDILKLAT